MRNTFYLLCFIVLSCNNPRSDSKSDFQTDDESENIKEKKDADCYIDDGKHSATVDYHNPKTGHSNTYNLDVEVENCQIITLYFVNGGYLDGSHINAADIDDNGDATVEDDRGRSFDVHIEQ